MSNHKEFGAPNKWCFVPRCTNTSINAPNKKFLSVPITNYSRKVKWFKAARRDVPKSKSTFYCCEDHFNLEEDMKSYIRYKLTGGKLILKEDVVPHIFDCQLDRKGAASAPERLKWERKRLVEEALMQDTNSSIAEDSSPVTNCHQSKSTGQVKSDEHVMKHVYQQNVLAKNIETIYNEQKYLSPIVDVDQPSTSTDQVRSDTDEHVVQTFYQQDTGQVVQTKSVGVQVKPFFRNKHVTCNIESDLRHTASTPGKPFVPKDVATSPIKNRVKKTVFIQSSTSNDGSEEVDSSSSVFVTTDGNLIEVFGQVVC